MIILMQMELPTPTAILVIEEYKSRRNSVVYAIERYVSADDEMVPSQIRISMPCLVLNLPC